MLQEGLVIVVVAVVVFLARNFFVRQEKQEALPEVEIKARIVDDSTKNTSASKEAGEESEKTKLES